MQLKSDSTSLALQPGLAEAPLKYLPLLPTAEGIVPTLRCPHNSPHPRPRHGSVLPTAPWDSDEGKQQDVSNFRSSRAV